MSRIHTHRRYKGKSGSKRVYRDSIPTWVPYTEKEVEKLIVELAKQGYTPAKIGLILRDQYGIPSVRQILGKKIKKFLEEQGFKFSYPEDLLHLMKKAVTIREHLDKNPKDKVSKRAYDLVLAKIHRLAKYYKRKRILPPDWRFRVEEARVIVARELKH
jgi:small subunit ribosomal protein S15